MNMPACMMLGLITAVGGRVLTRPTSPVWREIAVGVAGAFFGGFMYEWLDGQSGGLTPLPLAISFLGAVFAIVLGRSLDEPIGAE